MEMGIENVKSMKILSSYIPTVRALFEDFDAELTKYIIDSNVDEVWTSHDNWNGGIDFYNIIFNVPVDLFKKLKRRKVIEQAEKELFRCYEEAMRGEGGTIQISGVIIRPSTSDVLQLGNYQNETMWKPGYFRLFISHLSENKNSASNLKRFLQDYGIDGFVAHEDITPSKEWEQEIEAALFSLDALCAIVVPGFEKSQWCDQEVGIALGRRRMVFSIKKGKNPYGFFGKYQALPSQNSAKGMAKAVVKAICTNEFTRGDFFSKIVNLVLSASSEVTALRFIQVLLELENVDKQYVGLLHDNIIDNKAAMTRSVLNVVNPLFQKYGLSELQLRQQPTNESENLDMPF